MFGSLFGKFYHGCMYNQSGWQALPGESRPGSSTVRLMNNVRLDELF